MAAVRVPLSKLMAGERVLEGEPMHYLARVRRLRAEDSFVAFDPELALEAVGTVLEVGRESLRCALGEPRPGRVPERSVTLVQCLGKGSKPDEVVRAATALGVRAIAFCESDRAVVKVSDKSASRRQRWGEIALDAARQCGRADSPEISELVPLSQALERFSAIPGSLAIALEPSAKDDFSALLRAWDGRPLALLVGPEGGLTEGELDLAREHGFRAACFGPFALRTELAAIAALAAVLAHTRDSSE